MKVIMGIDLILGGQGGDEGKGKIVEWLSLNGDYEAAVRCPRPQAGHTLNKDGKRITLAQLSCAYANPNLKIFLAAGSMLSLERLLTGFNKKMPDGSFKYIPAEIPATGITPDKLRIDYLAKIITPEHKRKENENLHLMNKIGSVGEGISECLIEEIMRDPNLPRAKDIFELKPYLADTKKEMFDILQRNENILLEGDHGAKLDLIHGEYPFVTTRTVNAAGFLSEAGLGPREVRDVYVVLKPYTTRVAAGPMENEIFDGKVLSWALEVGGEKGSVSGRKRRVGGFEWENVKQVLGMNSATKLAFTHIDAPNFVWNALGYENGDKFLADVDKNICNQWPYPAISLLSYGQGLDQVMTYHDYLMGFKD
jgi:adenylosuccinate synthase